MSTKRWSGADMRCPTCNKYMPDRCTCRAAAIAVSVDLLRCEDKLKAPAADVDAFDKDLDAAIRASNAGAAAPVDLSKLATYDPDRDCPGMMELRDKHNDGDWVKLEDVRALLGNGPTT